MKLEAGKWLKWLYCLTLGASIFPSGFFGASGWTALATGGGWMRGGLLFVFVWFAVFGYRIFLVLRYQSTLDAFVTGRLVKFLRVLGLILMTVGLLGSMTILFLKPLALGIFGQPGESGVAFFVTGIFLYFISSVSLSGVMLFEASRLIGFEESLRQA